MNKVLNHYNDFKGKCILTTIFELLTKPISSLMIELGFTH